MDTEENSSVSEVQAELEFYSKYITHFLSSDPDLSALYPISHLNLVETLKSGVLLCKLINTIKPNTITTTSIYTQIPLSPFQQRANLNLAINSLRFLDPTLPACTYTSILDCDMPTILEILWRTVKFYHLNQISAENFSDLSSLIAPNNDPDTIWLLSPEELLLRWVNLCLSPYETKKPLINLTEVGVDTLVLVGKSIWGAEFNESFQWIVETVMSNELKDGLSDLCLNPTQYKFRVLILAEMFKSKFPKIQNSLKKVPREETAFRKWINSLNIPEISSQNLCLDLEKSPLKLLKLLNILTNGSTDLSNIPQIQSEPNQYWDLFWSVGKTLNFSLPPNRPLSMNFPEILSCVWEVIKFATLHFINLPNESDLLAWANAKLKNPIPDLSSESVPKGCLLDILLQIDKRVLENEQIQEYSPINEHIDPKLNEINAKALVSGIRKLGGRVYFSWEDIAEGNEKIALVVCAITYHLEKDYVLV